MDNKQLGAKENSNNRNFSLSSFTRAKDKMIAKNEQAYKSQWDNIRTLSRIRQYTMEEVTSIIAEGSLSEQQLLSRNYFYRDGYYKQIIIHHATLLKYMGLLIPNPQMGKDLSTSHIQKRYYGALDYVENLQLPVMLTALAQRALIDGSYFGIITENSKEGVQIIDLPSGYACSRFKDINGEDVVEFNLNYFNTIADPTNRKSALVAYPKFISKAYKEWSNGKRKSNWVKVPSEYGVCFQFFDGRPLFLSVIPSILQYDEAIIAERKRDAEEIHKIIVQKIPHLSDGRLLFEPDEVEEMHDGVVGMMKGDENVSVLTTYGDVDAITSNLAANKTDGTLQRMEQNIYAQAGVSSQIFAATGSASVGTSIDNDLALMMYMANKFSNFITKLVNQHFANSNIDFKYSIMPITYHNTKQFVEESFKLLGSGYSALVPSLALGMSQRDLINIKDLENNVLKVGEKLKPLATSYTQTNSPKANSGDNSEEARPNAGTTSGPDAPSGRPSKEEGEKAEKTIQNEESLDKTGGS